MATKLNVSTFEPAGTKIVIEPDFMRETSTGLIIPESVKQESLSPFGRIVAVGPGRQMESGQWFHVPFSPGMHVQVATWRGQPIEVNGRAMLCTDYEVVIGTITRTVEVPKETLNAKSN